MERILIVSGTDKGAEALRKLLCESPLASDAHIDTVKSAREASDMLSANNYELCVVNTPLEDEKGEKFAKLASAEDPMQVICILRCDRGNETAREAMVSTGIFTVEKPLNRSVFCCAVQCAAASYRRLLRLCRKSQKLENKIEDLQLIDRAKCLLIEYLRMSETEAHRYIEKQSMDLRITRSELAHRILKTYSN